jgi:hypothetical protein
MSNTSTYVTYSILDHNGVESLSSYTLPITPFRFIPDLPSNFGNRLVWEFGDGTTTRSLSAEKYYKFPGKYNVRLVVYDCNNNAMISTIEKQVVVYDYYPLTMQLIFNEEEGEDVILTESFIPITNEDGDFLITNRTIVPKFTNFECINGRIEGEIYVNTFFPVYQPACNVYYSVSGSDSKNYWEIYNEKFSHLDKFYSLYDKTYNYGISSFQFKQIDKIQPNPVELYVKKSNSFIIPCKKSDEGSCFSGLSSSNTVFFRDDSVSNDVILTFKFDKNNLYTDQYRINYSNNLGYSCLLNIKDNSEISHLSITSNGMDGEGFPIDSFNINHTKFFDTKIPFVIKIKDVENFSIKNFNPIELLDIDINISTPNYSLSSLNYTLSAHDHGGSIRLFVEFPYSGEDFIQNVSILASGTFVNDQLSSFTIEGESEKFDLYKHGYYDIFKKNEDFNPEETLKNLRFQEILIDKNILFEDFLGSALGNGDSDHDALGVKIYEKIANIVQNTQDIDANEYEFLNSLATMVGYNDAYETKYVFPESIKRIINLASINKAKLIGENNKFSQNFDIKGRATKTLYGINLGDEIPPQQYICNINEPIVALEKFSNSYMLLNTYQPLSSVGTSSYPLSSYSDDWGWGLVLPTNFDFKNIDRYYIFFEYVPKFDNTVIGGIVDFNNTKTNVLSSSTNDELYGDKGIINHMFLDTLYKSIQI